MNLAPSEFFRFCWPRRWLMILLLCAPAGAAQAASPEFPRPPELEPIVEFWRGVFVDYSEHQTILHDKINTNLIYAVLDFSDVVPLLDPDELRLHKRRVEIQEKERLKEVLLHLADNLDAADLSPLATQIKRQFAARGRLDPEHIRLSAQHLRGQWGLREKSIAALMRSGRYLPYMERVFAEAGLPVLLTRLPLVESSFNNAAYSKSGAAGVWQFMPGTARVYMNYDEVGDERRDPWFSTEAAAKHLRDDFERLQDWPLAVTAYNFGRNGIARALEEIGGNSLIDMIERYKHPRWGFAGKNFYAEFLAAVDVEQNALAYFGPIRRDAPDEFEEVTTEHYVSYDTLLDLSGEDAERFADLNPSFSTAVQRGELYVPPGKRIRLPQGKAPKFRHAYASLSADQLFHAQKVYFRQHRVRRGDTLSGLARRYKSSIRGIRQANGLSSKHFIRIGQVLKIPPTRTRQRSKPLLHAVRPGETLAGISRRYGVSVGSLQKTNGIDDPQRLQVGARLKVPGGQPPRVAYHTILSGQTVETIAKKYGVSIQAIASINGLQDVNRVQAGQRLKLPGS